MCGELIEHVADATARASIVLSEYGITPVRRPVHINRVLREAGCSRCATSSGASCSTPARRDAFAVADHQIAHVYVRRPELRRRGARAARGAALASSACSTTTASAPSGSIIRAPGELVALARADAWFTYYYWLDDARAPDFARTVDIHRKPGYDPVELFLDPAISRRRSSKIGWQLAQRSARLPHAAWTSSRSTRRWCGARTAASPTIPQDGPLVASSEPGLLPAGPVAATAVKGLLLEHVFGRQPPAADVSA